MVNGLGERLQQQRLAMNLSQKEVAGVIGVSPSIVSNYENNERTPSVEILMALAGLYRCSTDYLLGFGHTSADNSLDVSMLTIEQRKILQSFLSSFKN